MEGQVYEMVGAAVQAEKLAIEHVRNPRDWMPISFSSVQISKGPGESFWGQTPLDNSIGGDVIGVVVSDESKPMDAPKGGCGEHCQEDQNEPKSSHQCGFYNVGG